MDGPNSSLSGPFCGSNSGILHDPICCYCHIVAFFSDLFITATSAVLVVLVSKGCLYYIELVLLCTFLDVDAFFSCSQGCTLGKEKLPMHVISPTQTIPYVSLTFSRMNATKAL
jgi:hypothetical protein